MKEIIVEQKTLQSLLIRKARVSKFYIAIEQGGDLLMLDKQGVRELRRALKELDVEE